MVARNLLACWVTATSLHAHTSYSLMPSSPWFGEILNLEITPYYATRSYRHWNSTQGNQRKTNTAQISGLHTAFTPTSDYQVGLNFDFAKSAHKPYSFHHVKAFVGTHLLDEFYGDPCTLTLFGSIDSYSRSSVRDPIFHARGSWEYRMDLSIGKECTLLGSWTYRSYGAAGIGVAHQGSPFLRFIWAVEKNVGDEAILSFATDYDMGLGKAPLTAPYRGMGSLRSRGLSLSLGYRMVTWYYGDFGLQWRQNVFSKNQPRTPWEAALFWSFSLGP